MTIRIPTRITMKTTDKSLLQDRYGKSASSNFYVKEVISTPHPYCIGPLHVEVASKHHGGLLNEAAIKDAERAYGGHCHTCRGKLKFEEHEQALLVACKPDLKSQNGQGTELHNYLLAIKDKATEDGYAGFAFLDVR